MHGKKGKAFFSREQRNDKGRETNTMEGYVESFTKSNEALLVGNWTRK